MAFALLYTLLFALMGVCISSGLFRTHRFIIRIWFGLVLGLLLLTWLPSLIAFLTAFTLSAQLYALGVMFLLSLFFLIWTLRKNRICSLFEGFQKKDLGFLWTTIPLFILGVYLFSTHVLKPLDSGAVAVGQVTYGDLAMHLGFISSISSQGTFPPEYSIFPGHLVNYPFLCETSASSLLLLGANIRQAYLISALYAYLLVLMGVWFFFRSWLKKNSRATVATLLFFFGSGFGFAYFFDLAKHSASLNTLLDGYYFSNFSWLLDGFYDTPTNLPTLGLRWVNPIIDMLLPQRATLFGWAFLFPCLYLLIEFVAKDKRENILPLGLISGLLPLIHTHSFLALGILSAVFCLTDLITHFNVKRLLCWTVYAGIACLIGMPQLFGFAFRQASESGMVQLHWNWANEADSYLWFYVKNMGWIFLLLPVSFLLLGKRDRKIYLPSAVLWLISEMVIFQPNNYDNNKLLFIWFAFSCGLVAKFLCIAYRRIRNWIRKHTSDREAPFCYSAAACLLLLLVFACLVYAMFHGGMIAWYSLCSVLLIGGLCVYYLILDAKNTFGAAQIMLIVACCCTVYLVAEMLLILWRGYAQTTLYLDRNLLIILVPLVLISVVLTVISLILQKKPSAFSAAPAFIPLHLAVYLLTLTLTLSSVMTILREIKSEYQVYTSKDLEAVEFIRSETDPDSLFLANSYHWNLVTPLTGRSIVTGTSTFLYFHGINNIERENDVREMYEHPSESIDLFDKYGIDYVLFSNAERYNYECDEDFFSDNGTLVFENNAAAIYRLGER